ncbi:PD40 domain-containing protein [candidate division KSB1 bacterium]|nr:PD40 domain-containing protein [candidate division KSB1 bacterium]MBL7092947.1 PD40 domain-containing protein [candidate division KSB1 bacterium]
MSKSHISIFIVITLLLFSILTLFAQTQSQLFQQALLKENGEGDLKAAVTIYQKIVDDTNADRSVRAKAQLHIGMCWEKMGRQEAKEAYQKVMSDFNDQQTTVQQAKARLQNLEKNQNDKPVKPSYQKVIEAESPIISADSSPNGKFIAFQTRQDSISTLSIFNVVSKEISHIQQPAGISITGFKWSPKGDYIAFRGEVEGNSQKGLWIIPINQNTGEKKGKAILLIDNAHITDFDWNSNGEEICFVKSEQNNYSLNTIRLADRKITPILENFKKLMLNPIWSFDKNVIYYSAKGTSGNQSWDIFRLTIDTKETKQIIESNYLYDIAQDSKLIATRVIKPGEPLIRIASISGGVSQEFVLRKEFSHSVYASFLPDGKKLLMPSKRRDAVIKKVNLKNKTISNVSPEDGYYSDPLVSSDGKFLVYVETGEGGDIFHLLNIKDGSLKMIPTDDLIWLHSWSPNLKYLAYTDIAKKEIKIFNLESNSAFTIQKYQGELTGDINWSKDSKLMSYVIKSDDYKLFVSDLNAIKKEIFGSNNFISSAEWFSDNDRLVFATEENEKSRVFVYSNIKDQRKVLLETDLEIISLQISPDENWIAFYRKQPGQYEGQIYLTSLTGEDTKLIGPSNPRMIEKFVWLPDKNSIVINAWNSSYSKTDIYLLSVNGSDENHLTNEDNSIKYGLSLSPDGKEAYYWEQVDLGGVLWEVDISEAIEKLK